MPEEKNDKMINQLNLSNDRVKKYWTCYSNLHLSKCNVISHAYKKHPVSKNVVLHQ